MNTLFVSKTEKDKREHFRKFLELSFIDKHSCKINFPHKVECGRSIWYFVSLDSLDCVRGIQYNLWVQRGEFYMKKEIRNLLSSHCRGVGL